MSRSRIVPWRAPEGFVHIAALMLLAISGLTLAGHAFSPWPASSSLLSLRIPTASCFFLGGVGLWLQSRPGWIVPSIGQVFGATVALMGFYFLVEALRHGVNTPAPDTDAAFAILGMSLSLPRAFRSTHTRSTDALALLAIIISAPGLLGHIYGVHSLDQFPFYSSTTGIAATGGLLIFAAGILALSPEHGVAARLASTRVGGHMIRRLLPAALLVPALIGWVQLKGQRAALYGVGSGLVLFAVASTVIFVALVLRSGADLDRLDDERRAVLARLREANESLEARVAERTDALAAANQMLTAQVAERRSAENQARGFLESAPDAIVVTNPEGRIVLLNSQAERLFACTRAALLGRNIGDLVNDDARAGYRIRCAAALDCRGNRPEELLEIGMRTANGIEINAGMTLSTIRTDEGPLLFHDLRDISWQKRAERALKASETRFRAVADTANDAVVSIDDRGRIVYANPATTRLFGYDVAELAGAPVAILTPERYRDRHQAGLARLVAKATPRLIGRTIEIEGRRKDGSEFPLELSLARWQADQKTYFTGILRDISVRRSAEQKIRELNAALQGRAVELETLNKELEAFSYSVSHDLRAPLRSIDGFSQALLEDCAGQLDETGKGYLTRIRSGAQRMGNLIDDLLTLSKVARAEIVAEEIDMTEMAQRIGAELEENTRRHVDLAVAPGLKAHADPRLLRIALENLLGNAWKFTAARGDPRVEVGTGDDGPGHCFFVRDNGAGFDMAYAEKLFNAFQRLHDAREFPGTGVGLATVQRILRKHGGRIWAEAMVNQGATFYFTL